MKLTFVILEVRILAPSRNRPVVSPYIVPIITGGLSTAANKNAVTGTPKSFSIATATSAGMDGTRCGSVIKQHARKVSQGTYFVVYSAHLAVPLTINIELGQPPLRP